VELVVRVVF